MILTKLKISEIDLIEKIDEKIGSSKLDELLIIVPTNRKIRYYKKEIISSAPNSASSKINLETIGTFTTKLLLNDHNAAGRVLSEEASSVLIKQSCLPEQPHRQGFQSVKLNYFTHYKNDIPHGTLDRIRNVISEYKRQGISPAHLYSEAEKLSSSERWKAEDISAIYENYQNRLSNLGVKEIGDIYSELLSLNQQTIEERFRELYPQVNLTVINGFDEFTVPEVKIINSISDINDLTLFLSFDYYDDNPLIFSHLDRCYRELNKYGFEKIKDISEESHNAFEISLREKLFKGNSGKIDEYKESITKMSAQGREKEIEFIAKEIKNLIEKENVEPHKICIVFNLINKYSPVVRDQFKVYGIPFNLTDRYSLSNSPPIISIINFLEILENDFYYKNIFRALSSGYINTGEIDLSNLLGVSVDLKIVAGYENWKNRINDALSRIDEIEEQESDDAEMRKSHYKKALEDLEKINEALDPFNHKMTLVKFHRNLTDLLFKMNIPSKLLEAEPVLPGGRRLRHPSLTSLDFVGSQRTLTSRQAGRDDTAEEKIKALTTFLETINEILNLFKLEFGENEKFPLKFYLSQIKTAVASSRYNVKEKPNYGVQITTMNEIRGLKFDYLFISGLCDGDFPTRYTPEIFFSGSFARSENYHRSEERYHFYQSLCSWKKKLYLTYPRKEEKKDLVESNFLTEFSYLFDISEKTAEDYFNLIYSKEELLRLIGSSSMEEIINEYQNDVSGINFGSIKSAIEINKLRLNEPFGESSFTGMIDDNLPVQLKKELNELAGREYSITQLETYALCPFKYFAERILKLKTIEEPTEEIEAIEMGTLLHSILYEFYTRLKEKDIILFGCSDEEFKKAEKLIFEIAEEKINLAQFSSPLTFYEKEKILGINGNKNQSILSLFLNTERETETGYTPEFFEAAFGNIKDSKKRKVYENFRIDGIKVRGKIDRLEINKDENSFKVVDYKLSGKTPLKDDLLNGISLQIPLYLFAAKELIKNEFGNENYQPAKGEIYSLKFKKSEFGRKEVSTFSSRKKLTEEERKAELIRNNNELISICINKIKEYVESIERGKFNLSTLDDRELKVCRFCSFKSVCRVQEVN
jgi:ATP-dependent helicase/nuclease subunit B